MIYEIEVEQLTSRDGFIYKTLQTHPTEQEEGIQALVLWGLLQLAKAEHATKI